MLLWLLPDVKAWSLNNICKHKWSALKKLQLIMPRMVNMARRQFKGSVTEIYGENVYIHVDSKLKTLFLFLLTRLCYSSKPKSNLIYFQKTLTVIMKTFFITLVALPAVMAAALPSSQTA